MPLSAFAVVAVTLALGSLSLATNGQNVTVRTPDDRSPRTCADLVVTSW